MQHNPIMYYPIAWLPKYVNSVQQAEEEHKAEDRDKQARQQWLEEIVRKSRNKSRILHREQAAMWSMTDPCSPYSLNQNALRFTPKPL